MEQDPRLQYYTAYTLVDITETKNRFSDKEDPLNKSRNQQRNWEAVLQVLSFATQPLELDGPYVVTVNLKDCEFGKKYKGAQQVWSWTWATEHADVYVKDNNPFYALENGFSLVPVVTGLDETVKFPKPVFYIDGPEKNIYFKNGKY